MSIIKVNPLNALFGHIAQDVPGQPKVHNKHHKTAPADAVYIGRGSPWGNPFVIGRHGSREEVIAAYAEHVLPHVDLKSLKGKHLVCFCKPAACHGDLLLEAANR
jgi:hypothetical protein